MFIFTFKSKLVRKCSQSYDMEFVDTPIQQIENILRRLRLVKLLLRFDRQKALSGVAGYRKLIIVLLVVNKHFLSDGQRTLNGVSP